MEEVVGSLKSVWIGIGPKIEKFENLTCFSFYITKNIVTGEGGMVTTNYEEWADKIKMYGSHGLSKNACKRYSDEGFADLPVILPNGSASDTVHARHLYTLLLDFENLKIGCDTIQQALQKKNIGTRMHFISLHLHKYYQETFRFRPDDFTNVKYVSDRTISCLFQQN